VSRQPIREDSLYNKKTYDARALLSNYKCSNFVAECLDSQFVKTVCAMPKHITPERSIVIVHAISM